MHFIPSLLTDGKATKFWCVCCILQTGGGQAVDLAWGYRFRLLSVSSFHEYRNYGRTLLVIRALELMPV